MLRRQTGCLSASPILEEDNRPSGDILQILRLLYFTFTGKYGGQNDVENPNRFILIDLGFLLFEKGFSNKKP
jgi:hypothetical protein